MKTKIKIEIRIKIKIEIKVKFVPTLNRGLIYIYEMYIIYVIVVQLYKNVYNAMLNIILLILTLAVNYIACFYDGNANVKYKLRSRVL